ncbi:hypothetical protein KCF3NO3_06510 [Chryseobacterium sp. KCF3-3]
MVILKGMTTLGTKLRKLRDGKKISQSEIANILGVSQSAYNKWEADQARPSSDNLLKISDFHGVEIKDLLEDNAGIVSNNIFKDSSISHHIFNYAQTVNMQSPELVDTILKNQKDISKLIELQSKLIETLLKK